MVAVVIVVMGVVRWKSQWQGREQGFVVGVGSGVGAGAVAGAGAGAGQWQRHFEIRNNSNIGLSAEFPCALAKMRPSSHYKLSVKNSIAEVELS